jgi:hypothetical protein
MGISSFVLLVEEGHNGQRSDSSASRVSRLAVTARATERYKYEAVVCVACKPGTFDNIGTPLIRL